jgi:hypothetical protein
LSATRSELLQQLSGYAAGMQRVTLELAELERTESASTPTAFEPAPAPVRALELEPEPEHSKLAESSPTDPIEVMAAIGALERADDVFALVRRWGRSGNVAALEAVAVNSSSAPLAAFAGRLLNKLQPMAPIDDAAENA